jgi:hypothetical protein
VEANNSRDFLRKASNGCAARKAAGPLLLINAPRKQAKVTIDAA